MYFDGHERPDVIEARKEYIQCVTEADTRSDIFGDFGQVKLKSSTRLRRPQITVYRDETTFHACNDQTHQWVDDTMMTINPKTLGSEIMKQYHVERLLKNEYSGANMPSNTSAHSRCGKNFLPTEANKNEDTKPNEGKDFRLPSSCGY